MAEGWARHYLGDRIQPLSAGIEAHGMNPRAVQVMREAGVDITMLLKLIRTFQDAPLDLVITVCGHADENCPAFLGKSRVMHIGFDDPPKLRRVPIPRKKDSNITEGFATRFDDSSRKTFPNSLVSIYGSHFSKKSFILTASFSQSFA